MSTDAWMGFRRSFSCSIGFSGVKPYWENMSSSKEPTNSSYNCSRSLHITPKSSSLIFARIMSFGKLNTNQRFCMRGVDGSSRSWWFLFSDVFKNRFDRNSVCHPCLTVFCQLSTIKVWKFLFLKVSNLWAPQNGEITHISHFCLQIIPQRQTSCPEPSSTLK